MAYMRTLEVNLPRGLSKAATSSPMFFKYSILVWVDEAPVEEGGGFVQVQLYEGIIKYKLIL